MLSKQFRNSQSSLNPVTFCVHVSSVGVDKYGGCKAFQSSWQTSFTMLETVDRPTRKEKPMVWWLSPVAKYLKQELKIVYTVFHILLTVHHAMILGNCPTWRTNTFHCIYLFIYSSLHVSSMSCSSSGETNCINTASVYRVTITRSCIETICFSWWWAWHARNM